MTIGTFNLLKLSQTRFPFLILYANLDYWADDCDAADSKKFTAINKNCADQRRKCRSEPVAGRWSLVAGANSHEDGGQVA